MSALVWKCVHSWPPLLGWTTGEKTSVCYVFIFGGHTYWWGCRYSGTDLWHCVNRWVIRFPRIETSSPRLVVGSNDPLTQHYIPENGILNYKAAKNRRIRVCITFLLFFFQVSVWTSPIVLPVHECVTTKHVSSVNYIT
jgi:hypothetical protein